MNSASENDLLRRALALYAGDHVLQHVLRKGNDALRPEGQQVDATLLFVDVAGFTVVSESMTPHDVKAVISKWLELITDRIAEFGGTLDTYVGDAASGWWGPEHGDAHAKKACHCARGMVSDLENLNSQMRAKDWPQLKMGIGINTGRVILGTYGTAKRLRFTVLGDAVNLASRLCGLAQRQYSHSILLSESTKSVLGNAIPTVEVDRVRVKGRDAPMKIYALISLLTVRPTRTRARAPPLRHSAKRAPVGVDVRRLMFGSRENDLLKKALALFAGEHVLQHVLRNGERAFVVDPATVDLTIMFVDVVANFSEIREDLTPNELNEFMASFLEVTTNGIIESGGTVDTYVGDSTSAWWGANGEKDHAHSAVICARHLVAEMSRLNKAFQAKGWPVLKLCVGMASGRVRLGAYGSSKRLRYSVLGDTVNLSSRLCGLAAWQYPHDVLIAESTQKRLEDSLNLVPVDTVRLKGRDEPLQLFTV